MKIKVKDLIIKLLSYYDDLNSEITIDIKNPIEKEDIYIVLVLFLLKYVILKDVGVFIVENL